jgi:hypothetical protein
MCRMNMEEFIKRSPPSRLRAEETDDPEVMKRHVYISLVGWMGRRIKTWT